MANLRAKIEQARIHMEAGRYEQARAGLVRLFQQHPGEPIVSGALLAVLTAMGRIDQAVFYGERAAASQPSNPEIWLNLGNALGMMGRAEPSRQALERALSLAPTLVQARLGLANLNRDAGEFAAAAAQLLEGLKHRPHDLDLRTLYASILPHLGRADEAADIAAETASAYPDDPAIASMLANALNYVPNANPEQGRQAHLRFGELVKRKAGAPLRTRAPEGPDRPLRLGILSYDLRRHSVAYFLEPLLRATDRASMQVVCYSTFPAEDEMTSHLKGLADEWCAASSLDDRALAERIFADNIDILIETSGLTRGHRLGVMALRPAPLQITFLGYPNSTGLDTIDLRIVDSITDPPGEPPPGEPPPGPEELARLDPCFLCYAPPREAPDVSPAPALTSGAITFGSFNAVQKTSSVVLSAWAKLLQENPQSKLIIKAIDLREQSLRDDLLSRLQSAGADPSRITIHPPTDSLAAHLAIYAQVDLALDTFPYTGTTTTFEALYMGVPTVTLRGNAHASRVSASILSNLGLPEFIADTPEGYIKAASALARDASNLDRLRRELRPRLAASPLCDAPAYASRFGALLRDAWRARCTQNAAPR